MKIFSSSTPFINFDLSISILEMFHLIFGWIGLGSVILLHFSVFAHLPSDLQSPVILRIRKVIIVALIFISICPLSMIIVFIVPDSSRSLSRQVIARFMYICNGCIHLVFFIVWRVYQPFLFRLFDRDTSSGVQTPQIKRILFVRQRTKRLLDIFMTCSAILGFIHCLFAFWPFFLYKTSYALVCEHLVVYLVSCFSMALFANPNKF